LVDELRHDVDAALDRVRDTLYPVLSKSADQMFFSWVLFDQKVLGHPPIATAVLL